MEQKKSKIFNSKNIKTIEEYCKLNNIVDVDEFTYQCFKQGFDVKKYGFMGKSLNEGEKHLKTDDIGEKDLRDSRKTCGIEEKREGIEVIREKQAEKEVIKTVEVIKEVPVEIVVEKIIYTTDDIQINELGGKIAKLEQELSTKTTEIGTIRQEFSTKTEETENIFQNEMSKKDEELDELRQKLDILVTNNRANMLQETLLKLRKDLILKDKRIEELEGINKQLETIKVSQGAVYLKGSNITQRL
jgi:ElaB/YqjD/DUF883 family membrane-anchored ribosome-binding protein